MLQLSKKDLTFLSLYNFCADTKTEYSDKFRISGEENSKDIVFSMINSKGILLTSIIKDKKKESEKFIYIFPVVEFFKMSGLVSDNDEITIKPEGISFGKGSEYKFESFDFLNDIYESKSILKLLENKNEEVTINNFNFSKEVDFCIGLEKGFDNIAILHDLESKKEYFVTSDFQNQSITGAIKNNDTLQEDIHIDSLFYRLLKTFSNSAVLKFEVNKENSYFKYFLDNTHIISPFIESSIFNIFEQDKKDLYEHKFKFSFDKSLFIKSLEKLVVVTNTNLKNRISVFLNNGNIVLENKDGIAGKETVEANVDKELQGQFFAIKAHSILKAVKELNEKEIFIKIDSDIDNVNVIKVSGAKEDKFFIINLLEKI